ncbi:adenylate/guanylate cyclase domain-containing protein [Agromyces tardus]|uniref:adenylate/guanylate cyclase domain-containing protein n=1 Tax=Agromyces tardus TaxID=2583849 RepID=UPI00110C43A3|nr:adenylate/guanylate cyclase domain-containing protein [Agromyces tardus]
MSETTSAKPAAGGRIAARVKSLSIFSILLIVLLASTVIVSIVVGLIGYFNGASSLTAAASARLVEVRDARADRIEALFGTVEDQVALAAASGDTRQALRDFTAAYDELDTGVDPSTDAAEAVTVEDWYHERFGPELAAAMGDADEMDVSTFLPTSRAERYLRAAYTVPSESFADALAVDDAGDGSTWSAVHRAVHPYFRAMTERMAYEDVLLIDRDGRVVYTAYKGVDLGTDLIDGPYRMSDLADAYRLAMNRNVPGDVVFTDFAPYVPSLGVPAAWAVSPVVDDGQVLGAIAVEMPIDAINDAMAVDADSTGLGDSGETYLVGPDRLMRSNARLLEDDPKQYVRLAVAAGALPEVAELAARNGDTIMLQPVTTPAVAAALRGESGVVTAEGYLGGDQLTAYAPLPAGGLDWVVIAQMDRAEALGPVDDFTRGLFLSTAAIVIIVSLLSVVLARLIVRPLRSLRDGARAIAEGNEGVQVRAGFGDELADVAAAFNDMSRSLEAKSAAIAEHERETERLVLSFMPAEMAERYRKGDRAIATDHQDVTVVFVDLVGFEGASAGLSSTEALEMLNDVFHDFDDVAERVGVERVRTTRQGYLASCGLAVPRVDHARRALEFALALQEVVDRWNDRNGTELSVRAGLDSGRATSGLVGQARVVYDLWGDAVNLAFRVSGDQGASGVFATERVIERARGHHRLEPAGEIETSSGVQRVWRVEPQ